MKHHLPFEINPKLDLVLERTVPVPRKLVWKAWTTPELLVQWFTPAPWKTVACEIDLRPGGKFKTVMQSPEGTCFGQEEAGCYLEVVELERLVWTSALQPGYRPAPRGEGFAFTACILMRDAEEGTQYTAIALHETEQDQKQHADMGFHQGWGTALDQLVALMSQQLD